MSLAPAHLCPACGVELVEEPWQTCEPCRPRGPEALERELAALVGAPDPSALRVYLTTLVRERDAAVAKVAVLEQRLARMIALGQAGADPLLLQVSRLQAELEAERSARARAAKAVDVARGQVP